MDTAGKREPDSGPSNLATALTGAMRLHLLWFVPLVVAEVAYFVVPSAVSGYQNTLIVLKRFSWGIFVSPAAALFFSSIIASVLLPIRLLLLIPVFFEAGASRRWHPLLSSAFVVIAIWVAEIFLQFVAWGSFPVPADPQGFIHLRLIPFLPWPDQPFGE